MTGPACPPPVVIVDNMFPRLRTGGTFSGRKHAEYTGLLARLEHSLALCPPTGAFSVRHHAQAVQRLSAQTGLTPGRFIYGPAPEQVARGLAYTVFPHKAQAYLPYLEAAGLRFVVTVYPGGGFLIRGPREAESLARLTTLATHPGFRGFVVHHDLIQTYLADHLPQAPLYPFDGGFSQIDPSQMGPKTYFGQGRDRLNLCFMANRYDPLGQGKGFDVFLEAARQAQGRFDNVVFHVIGDWPQDETAGVRPDDPVVFHGYVGAAALPGLFQDMDLIVSPTRADIPVPGKFDGFPLVIDAAVCGVAICASDPLGQNKHYRAGKDLWIIQPEAGDVLSVIAQIMAAPRCLAQVAQNGMQITRRTRNYTDKIDKKARLLQDLAAAG